MNEDCRVIDCHGGLFQASQLYFRGQKIWLAAMEELMDLGMKNADQVCCFFFHISQQTFTGVPFKNQNSQSTKFSKFRLFFQDALLVG